MPAHENVSCYVDGKKGRGRGRVEERKVERRRSHLWVSDLVLSSMRVNASIFLLSLSFRKE